MIPVRLFLELHPTERRATVIGARYTNAEHSAVILTLEGATSIEANAVEHPGLWAALAVANAQIAPFLTIQTARYANPDNTAAIIEAVQSGRKAISAADTPELWAQLLAWEAGGNTIAAYVQPPPPVKPDLATIKGQLDALQVAVAALETADGAAV